MTLASDLEPTLLALALLIGTTDAPVLGSQFASRRLGDLWDRARQLEHGRERIGLASLQLTPPELELLGALCSSPALGAMRLADMQHVARQIVDRWLDHTTRLQLSEAMREHSGRALVLDVLQRCQRIDAGETQDVTRIELVAQQIWDEVQQVQNEPALAKPRGVPTGVPVLDERLTFHGLPRGHITVLGGATSNGKSALANTCLLSAARRRMSVLCVSLEDDARAVVTRTISTVSGIQNRALQRREVAPSERQAFAEAVSETAGFRVAFMERTPSAAALGQAIRSYCLQNDVDLCVVDYLQLVPVGVVTRSKQERIDAALEELVHTARSLPKTATLLLSQLRRIPKGTTPTLDDLYHSGAIEQWAHSVAILWRPELKEQFKCVALLVEKQKNGPTGMLSLGWDPEHVAFSDPDSCEAARFEAAVRSLRGGK